MALREKKQVEEARTVTAESQQCQAELLCHGIVIIDFQSEIDNVERVRQVTGSTSRSSQTDSIRAHADSGADSEEDEDEVVMMGRKHIDTGRRSDVKQG